MAQTILHKADSRGDADHGWLHSRHTFSFAGYYNPDRMNFGALRVLNDDTVAAGRGFGTHPHDNMEIISIPLEGELEHRDNMGNVSVIKKGDIQVMSAGTGITHSEYNRTKEKPGKFLQIWVIPNRKNVTPRYGQITLNPDDFRNRFLTIVSPYPGDGGVWIYQDAWFSISRLDKGVSEEYSLKKAGNGVYLFIIKGSVTAEGFNLQERDGLGILDTDRLTLRGESIDSEILLMEVPMLSRT